MATGWSAGYKEPGPMSKLEELVATMRKLGVTRLRMDGEDICEVELSPTQESPDLSPPSADDGDAGPTFDPAFLAAEGKCVRCKKLPAEGLVPGHCRKCGKLTVAGVSDGN